ncbi:MAG: UDP-N-acetylmuramate--L-alanine ligase [Burkholderiaceae bacterium]|nr:UDP-N-acetylmuramate--L-alanine ligase [Burkholderiaceae bacterium]
MKFAIKHLHFVGIGGTGMNGIAEVLLNLGYEISGSDLNTNAATDRLKSLGAQIYKGHRRENVGNAGVVIISSAVHEDNPEVQEARFRNIPVVPRAVMLAELMRLRRGVAVAGTHGKTTTTSLVASILGKAGLDPTFVIGGRLNAAGANARLGTGGYIVAEADESDASFLNLNPVISVVTNIDADHMDTYGHDINKLKEAFCQFLGRLPFYGVAVVCIENENIRDVLPKVTRRVLTYGFCEEAKIRAVNVVADGLGMKYTVLREGREPLNVRLNLPGKHNVLNSLAAIGVATILDVSDDAIVEALASFQGVGRRFAIWGEVSTKDGGSFTLVDDYGHHPNEMAATIAAARGAFPTKRLVVAFQPHRYTRTRDCFEDLVRVLSTADQLILTEVYAAGDQPIVGADGRSLCWAIRMAGKVEPIFAPDLATMKEEIENRTQDGDVVLIMGAGNIGRLPGELIKRENQ